MLQKADISIADRAKKIYNDRLKGVLEATEPNKFVAIEPESGDYFVGVTLSEARQSAVHLSALIYTYVSTLGHATPAAFSWSFHESVCRPLQPTTSGPIH